MSQPQLLNRAVSVLESMGVAYMVTGSLVSTIQGEPRSTHDIDLVVAIRAEDALHLARAFPPPDYYLDEIAIRDAIARRDMFNLLDVNSGDKIDFWLLTDEPFDRERFARRISTDVLGVAVRVSTPEDTILQKLSWIQKWGPSEKQFHDALRVYEIQHKRLDLAYVERWIAPLNLGELWQRLTTDAQPL